MAPLGLLFFALLVAGIPAPSPGILYEDPTLGRAPAFNSCAVAGAYAQEASRADPTEYYPRIPASAAIDCLLTVPFNATDGLQLLESLKPYLQWQSTLAYLKSPPPNYWREPHDLLGGIQEMIDNIGRYDSEYRFELDLYIRFALAYDGHLRYYPKLLFDFLSFGRPYTLISVSEDGIQNPKVYEYDELIEYANTTRRLPHSIIKIDGHDVDYAMDQTAKWASSNDPDAAYNQNFYSPAQGALGFMGNGAGIWAGGGRGQTLFPGDFTTIEWVNGTESRATNFARVLVDFENITSGQELYDKYLGSRSSTYPSRLEAVEDQDISQAHQSQAKASNLKGPPGYPQPIVNMGGNAMGGYYMAQRQDAAVLSLQSFGGGHDSAILQTAITNFLEQAKTDGKTRLIIDLSANGGGLIDQVYSLFKTLFPDIEPSDAGRLRATEDVNIIGGAVTKAVGTSYPWNYDYPPGPAMLLNNYLGTPLIGQADLNSDGRSFGSWAEKFGPHEYHGDNFTSLLHWNMSAPTGNSNFEPIGYGNRTSIFPERPFAAEDIVLFTDGYCASACHTFLDLVTIHIKNIKTVTVGGRPSKPGYAIGPMQAVGGVRGANVYSYELIYNLATGAPSLLPNTSSPEERAVMEGLAAKYNRIPMHRGSGAAINVRDSIRVGDEEQTPLQFVYQPADCRIFYQAYHTFDMSTLWETVYDVAWEGGRCAYGEGYKPARSGDGADGKGQGLFRKRDIHRLANMDELGQQWKKLVTDVRRIKDMGAFQMP